MPLYEFQCQSCQSIEELLMKISDPQPAVCPKCGRGPLVKMMSKTSFVLKGSGWYATDFKTKPNPTKPGQQAHKAPAMDLPDAAAKTEAKPSESTDAPVAAPTPAPKETKAEAPAIS